MADSPPPASSPSAITASSSPLKWRLEPAGTRMRALLSGEINENCDLTELKRALAGDVELDLENITRINSCGVREWVNFMRSLDERVERITFARCSPTVVLQLNTIYNFRGRARVVSFFAPYVCEVCHVDEYRLLDVAEHFPHGDPHLPAFRCQRCGGVMMFDELPERYLSFLNEAP
jgi:ABC-type transporter Mla MlaB component